MSYKTPVNPTVNLRVIRAYARVVPRRMVLTITLIFVNATMQHTVKPIYPRP